MARVDLNCDLGESFGAYTLGMDEQVAQYITSANVACGYHAGDPQVMARTVRMCARLGVAVGAHPGFPDLVGFGRRTLAASPREVYGYVLYQLGALGAFCRAEGVALAHVKPHGALYNQAGKDRALADAVCRAVRDYDSRMILLGLAGSQLIEAAQAMGLRVAREVFADRAYEADGSLVARGKPGAMIEDEALAIRRVARMVQEGKVTTLSGVDIVVDADSVCVHGDGPKALDFVRRIREHLEQAGVEIVPMGRD